MRSQGSSPGFSLLELIIATGILGLIFTMGFVVFRNQLIGTLDSEAKIISTRLGGAQNRAITSMHNSQWGIYFESTSTPFYALFAGASYTGAASSTYLLSNLVEFQTPALGNNTSTVFSKLSGSISATTTVVVRLKSDTAQTKTITVSPGGRISVE
ncbi:MAG: prepilin-type N-terminal cleavage/methylation domain-containing protein [Patescibacteria group bacterium]